MLRRLHKDVSAWEEEQGQPFVVAGVELRPKLAELISVRTVACGMHCLPYVCVDGSMLDRTPGLMVRRRGNLSCYICH